MCIAVKLENCMVVGVSVEEAEMLSHYTSSSNIINIAELTARRRHNFSMLRVSFQVMDYVMHITRGLHEYPYIRTVRAYLERTPRQALAIQGPLRNKFFGVFAFAPWVAEELADFLEATPFHVRRLDARRLPGHTPPPRAADFYRRFARLFIEGTRAADRGQFISRTNIHYDDHVLAVHAHQFNIELTSRILDHPEYFEGFISTKPILPERYLQQVRQLVSAIAASRRVTPAFVVKYIGTAGITA